MQLGWYGRGMQLGWERREMHNIFWLENKGTNHLKDIGIDVKTILERKIRWETVGLSHLAQDGEQWRALVNKVINLRVP
jgi:hypothetical protein